MWPKTLNIIQSKDFIRDPLKFRKELHPLIADRDYARRELDKYLGQQEFEPEVETLQQRVARAQNRADVPADIKEMLVSQADLIDRLSSNLEF